MVHIGCTFVALVALLIAWPRIEARSRSEIAGIRPWGLAPPRHQCKPASDRFEAAAGLQPHDYGDARAALARDTLLWRLLRTDSKWPQY